MAKPLTVVGPSVEVTMDEMAAKVVETRERHGQLLQDYHKVWYESGHTWVYTQFAGLGLMKSPNDLWALQDLIYWHRPRTVFETGTYQGGSALWMAFLMDFLGIEDGRIVSIDIEPRVKCSHPRITFLEGDSTDPKYASMLREELEDRPGPLLVVLDADHSEAHVRKELDLYAPLCAERDWLVVEDTNIAWVGEGGVGGDRGARGGLEDYLREHEGEWRQDVLMERWLLTCHPGGWLQRVAPCRHV